MNRDGARAWTEKMARRFLPGEEDPYAAFIELLSRSCPPGGRVVDLGCGEEHFLRFLESTASEIVGVDARPLSGPYSRYLEADLDREIPLPEGSADLVVAKFLLEHLREPGRFLQEVRRILRPGASLVLITPNTWYYPYAVNRLLSMLLPQSLRMFLVRMVTGRKDDDVYPVFYPCNTPPRLRRLLEEEGFEIRDFLFFSDLYVTAVTRFLGILAVFYEVLLNRLGWRRGKGFMVVRACRGGNG